MTKPTFAIIGAGAVGLATAADLVRRGYTKVRLCDIDPQVVDTLVEAGGIHYEGLVGSGFSPIQMSSHSHAEAISGADIIMISTIAATHASIAASIAPDLSEGQVVILHQGCTGGAFLFARELRNSGCRANILLADTMNTVYFCGRPEPNSVFIKGVKSWIEMTSYPAGSEDEIIARLDGAFPQFSPGTNSLETGLNNPNPMIHVPSYLFNLGMVDQKPEASPGVLYLGDIVSEPIKRIVLQLDDERLSVMNAYGLNAVSFDDFGSRVYPPGSNLLSGVPRFGPILLLRFIEEDLPTGLVPIASLASVAGIETPVTNLLIRIASLIWGVDFMKTGRTIAHFGLTNLDPSGIVAAFVGSDTTETSA